MRMCGCEMSRRWETFRPGASLLAGSDLFSGLSPDALSMIERTSSAKRFAPEQRIIERDTRSRDVFFVVSGRARVLNYSVSGREIVLDDLSPGSCFGEVSAIDDQPRLVEVIATTDVTAAVIPQLVFKKAIETYPQVALAVMRRLAQSIRAADERIMDLSTLPARQRVHAEVLRRARARMVSANEAEIAPIPVHSEIAGKASTTRETVARAINDLARRGIVSRKKTALRINDVKALHEMIAATHD